MLTGLGLLLMEGGEGFVLTGFSPVLGLEDGGDASLPT